MLVPCIKNEQYVYLIMLRKSKIILKLENVDLPCLHSDNFRDLSGYGHGSGSADGLQVPLGIVCSVLGLLYQCCSLSVFVHGNIGYLFL